ncbi:MAG: glycosyltransferase family protein [Planctomycetota bacterium]|jgi:hypothetical protein
MIVVHVTHEAVEQIGGIGTVIAGLMTSDAYQEHVSRTILLGPLFQNDAPANRRIGSGGEVIYSSLDSITPPEQLRLLGPVERTHDVQIVYGRRPITDACTGKTVEAEVLLVNVFHANRKRLNLFKGQLFKKFDIPSDRFEHIWDFEQYVRLAEPGFEALQAIGANGEDEDVVILSHEYMGVPTALKAALDGSPRTRTVFYAHEVASVRPLVETYAGHDTTFYNIMDRAQQKGLPLEEVFDSVRDNYKHPLVKAARHCDEVFAVGEFIQRELSFVDRHFSTMTVDLVFNGIPAERITLAERLASRERMRQYAANLFGLSAKAPTWIVTHVARPVLSKGIWRDLRVLHELERPLAERGESAVYFMLGTLGGQRRSRDVRHMEQSYGWPVNHEHGYPDLTGGEDILAEMFQAFNADHHATKAVLVNQWDWNHQRCGRRMPEAMTFGDIRRGTDVELGLSVYEPFGISQLEPLCYGAICVVSNVCGCLAFARRMAGEEGFADNIIEGNFLHAPESLSIDELKDIEIPLRDEIEAAEGRRLANALLECLRDDPAVMAERLERGYDLASRMSWDEVVIDYFLPGLGHTVEG